MARLDQYNRHTEGEIAEAIRRLNSRPRESYSITRQWFRWLRLLFTKQKIERG